MNHVVERPAALVAEAGHCGPEIRSDVHVRVEPHDRGGIEIELESRVKPYYGESIHRQAEEVLEALGIRHAKLQIHDEGALPFVIGARIEAAVRRAGLDVPVVVLGYDYREIKSRDVKIKVSGDLAVMYGMADFFMSTDNRPLETLHLQFTLVWVREGGAWRLLLRQTTRVPG